MEELRLQIQMMLARVEDFQQSLRSLLEKCEKATAYETSEFSQEDQLLREPPQTLVGVDPSYMDLLERAVTSGFPLTATLSEASDEHLLRLIRSRRTSRANVSSFHQKGNYHTQKSTQ